MRHEVVQVRRQWEALRLARLPHRTEPARVEGPQVPAHRRGRSGHQDEQRELAEYFEGFGRRLQAQHDGRLAQGQAAADDHRPAGLGETHHEEGQQEQHAVLDERHGPGVQEGPGAEPGHGAEGGRRGHQAGGTEASFAARDVAERLAGSVSGSVVPFARDPELDPVVDPGLLVHDEIFFNAARLDRSVALATADYLALARPRVVAMAQQPLARRPAG